MLVARLLQGFSIGGEFGTSTAFLIELAPPNRTGYFGAWYGTPELYGDEWIDADHVCSAQSDPVQESI